MNRVFKKNNLAYFFALLIFSFYCSQALAATLTVPTTAYPTIQSAVDTAMAGDTVKVKWGGGTGPNGEYQENVVIHTPINLTCLAKKNKGNAVIDVSNTVTTYLGADFSAGISVETGAPGTVIKGCVVQFAQDCDPTTSPPCNLNSDDGMGIEVRAPDVQLLGVAVHGNQQEGIRIHGVGDNFKVSACQSNANGGAGFRIGEAGFLTTGGTMQKSIAIGNGNNGGAEGFIISCNGCNITNNDSDQNDTDGFYIEGDGNIIKGNSATANNVYGYQILGNNHTISGNRADISGDDCFRIGDINSDGNDNAFTNNIAINCGNDGFDVDCNSLGGTCGNIIGNRAIGVVNEAFDLNFHRDNTIAKNHAELAENQGFRLSDLMGVMFQNNTAVNNGRAGIRSSDGIDNTFYKNISKNNGGDGLRLVNAGEGALIEANKIEKNWQDGIDINREISIGNILHNNSDE